MYTHGLINRKKCTVVHELVLLYMSIKFVRIQINMLLYIVMQHIQKYKYASKHIHFILCSMITAYIIHYFFNVMCGHFS